MPLGAKLPRPSFPVVIETMPATQNQKSSSQTTIDSSSNDLPTTKAKRKRSPKVKLESDLPVLKKKKSAIAATKKKASTKPPPGPARCKTCSQVLPKAALDRMKKEEEAKRERMKQKRIEHAEAKKMAKEASEALTTMAAATQPLISPIATDDLAPSEDV